MSIPVDEIVSWFEAWAPASLAEPEDPIGLQIGKMNQSVTTIATALDITESVVDEAIQRGAELIIAHHPLIYRPLRMIRADQPNGNIISKLLSHQISVYIAHTNLDVAEGGVNDMLAQLFGLEHVTIFKNTKREEWFKLIVFIPKDDYPAVSEAMFAAGAGSLGNYRHCGFASSGIGTFVPLEGAIPTLGVINCKERVEEIRFETIVPAKRIDTVIQAMRGAIPYEEVAYDLMRLEQGVKHYGLGRIGTLPQSMTLEQFSEKIKQALDISYLRIVGDPERLISKVAVLGGSGRSYIKHAINAGVDVYITGDIDHHTAHDALSANLALIDPGHHMEHILKFKLAERLNQWLQHRGVQVNVYASEISTDPFQWK
jgi:dinuclear metal center YbgI/SA1388 family protein